MKPEEEFLLFVSRHQLQVVGGCHIVISAHVQPHLQRHLCYRLMNGHKCAGYICVDLQRQIQKKTNIIYLIHEIKVKTKR